MARAHPTAGREAVDRAIAVVVGVITGFARRRGVLHAREAAALTGERSGRAHAGNARGTGRATTRIVLIDGAVAIVVHAVAALARPGVDVGILVVTVAADLRVAVRRRDRKSVV